MKRMAALMGALLLTLVVAAPAMAARPVTYTVAAADCGFVLDPGFREWEAGRTWHGRDFGSGEYELFLLVGNEWVGNGFRYISNNVLNLVPSPAGYSAQGEVQVRGSLFGDFDGAWMSNSSGVRSTLRGLDGALYGHLKFAVVGQSMVDVVVPDPPDVACGVPFQDDWFEISTWTLN
jgi:hypothetical protein